MSGLAAIRCAAVLTIALGQVADQGRPLGVDGDVRALLSGGMYERAEAIARSHVHVVRAAYGDKSIAVAAAGDDLVRALIMNGRGANLQTVTLARQTLRDKEMHLGTVHADLVPSLLNLGDALAEAAEFDEAIALSERGVALRRRTAGADNLEVAEALERLGGVLSLARHYDAAMAALERSRRLKESELGQQDVRIARTLEAIGLVLQRQGLYDRAGRELRRAMAIQEAVSVTHPAYARTLNLIAQQFWLEGRMVESRKASEQAVAVAERALRPDHPLVTQSLRYLAATLDDLGDAEQALLLKQRALALAEQNFGANHHVTAEYLHDVGLAALGQGAYATARQHFRHALRIFEQQYGPWHEYVATTLSTLARANARLGDYANARREQARAVSIHERVGGPNHPFVALGLTGLAAILRNEGKHSDALQMLERALAIREKNLGPAHRDVAATLADLASTLMQTGQTMRAQSAATRALRIWERLGAPDAPDFAALLALYGELQLGRGDNAAARDYYEHAMAIRARVLGVSNPSYADAQAGLALALARLGDRTAALRMAASAEAAGREHLRTMLRSLPERQSLAYSSARPRGLDLILSLASLSPEAGELALDSVIRSRALVLDEMAARRMTRRTAPSDSLRSALASFQQRVANLMVRGPGVMSAAQYNTILDDARREAELAEEALAVASVEFQAERVHAQRGLADVRASLPADSALISFVRFEHALNGFGDSRASRRSRPSPRRVELYLAFILRSQQPPTVVSLGAAQTVDLLVSRWRADVAAEGLTHNGPTHSSRASGAALRRIVWDPLAQHLDSAARVFIVPDGTLSLVPFVALPAEKGAYLLERAPVLHYLSAERDLMMPDPVGTRGKGLLAVGEPAFDDDTLFGSASNEPTSLSPTGSPNAARRAAPSQCDGLGAVTFRPLQGTLQEVMELSRLWNTRAIRSDEVSRVLVSREASEPVFKKEAHRYRVLHLATHGFFLGGPCSTIAASVRGVGGLVDPDSADPRATENPLSLSGLALAGANLRQTAEPDEDDGVLTAEEVASLDLSGVEWAVLSACDTGVGEIKAGEGVFGLRRAFQVAGARTVIMSLWSVNDLATRDWMRTLYEARIRRNLSTADAVHEASLTALHDRRAKGLRTDPFYWAGFVAAGDWR